MEKHNLKDASAQTIYLLAGADHKVLQWIRDNPGHGWKWYYDNAPHDEWKRWIDNKFSHSNDDYDEKLIEYIINLERLSLSDNQLKELPAEIGQLVNLERLSLSGNQLTSLPAEIGQLRKLKELSLFSNPIKDIEAIHEMLPNTDVWF